nr:CAP domain-containing protein [uncultured Peptoniphilus sp.]
MKKKMLVKSVLSVTLATTMLSSAGVAYANHAPVNANDKKIQINGIKYLKIADLEKMGFKVIVKDDVLILEKDGKIIHLKLNEKTALVNGLEISLSNVIYSKEGVNEQALKNLLEAYDSGRTYYVRNILTKDEDTVKESKAVEEPKEKEQGSLDLLDILKDEESNKKIYDDLSKDNEAFDKLFDFSVETPGTEEPGSRPEEPKEKEQGSLDLLDILKDEESNKKIYDDLSKDNEAFDKLFDFSVETPGTEEPGSRPEEPKEKEQGSLDLLDILKDEESNKKIYDDLSKDNEAFDKLFNLKDENSDKKEQDESPEQTPEIVYEEITVKLKDGKTATVKVRYDEAMAQKHLDLLNNYRKENGLPEVKDNKELVNIAKERVAEIVYEKMTTGTISHTRTNGDEIKKMNDFAGENIQNIRGTLSESEMKRALDNFINSPVHNEVMKHNEYDRNVGVGVGNYEDSGVSRVVVVQLYGKDLKGKEKYTFDETEKQKIAEERKTEEEKKLIDDVKGQITDEINGKSESVVQSEAKENSLTKEEKALVAEVKTKIEEEVNNDENTNAVVTSPEEAAPTDSSEQ